MDIRQEQLDVRAKRTLLLAAGLALSQLPYVITYFLNLRRVSHYDFYPLVILLFGGLLWKQRSAFLAVDERRLFCARVLLYLSAAVAVMALAFMSPWASYFSSLLALSLMLMLFQRADGQGSLLKFSLLLWVLWQPPYSSLVNGDVVLTAIMQRESSRLVSASLDWTGYIHVGEGNVIELPGKTLGVAEACSGIQSLFLLIAIATFFGVFFNRSWLHTLLLALSAMLWTLVTNTLRIDVIAFAHLLYKVDLAHGWIHDLLGYAMMLVGVGLISSCDQLLLTILPRRATKAISTTPGSRILPPRDVSYKPAVMLGCLIFSLQILDISTLSATGRTQIDFFDRDPLVEVERDWLPETLAGWNLTDFKTEMRVTGADLGQRSDIWTYQMASMNLTVSVDQAFPGWHELTRCYQSRGWECNTRVCSNENSVLAALDRNGEHAVIAFALMNQDGVFLEPPESWSAFRASLHRIQNRLSPRLRRSLFVESAYQIQVFGKHTTQEEVEKMLQEASKIVAIRLARASPID